MATKITRATQQIFGINAGPSQIAQFGSLAAAAPAFTQNPVTIQALSNFTSGWFAAVEGANSPAIEDMNALCYLYAYQLAYLMQEGVAEWDAATTYFTGSIVQDGSGNMFTSLTNNNLNNALTSNANWRGISGGTNVNSVNPVSTPTYTMTSADNGKQFWVNSAVGAVTFNLPTPVVNFHFKVKDSGFNANTNNITFHRAASELFEGIAADYVGKASGGVWDISTDGTNWCIVGGR